MEAPLTTPVTEDSMLILSESSSFKVPNMFLPKSVDNHGNYIISLSQLCQWMGEQAEELGVEILEGIAGNKVLFNDDGSVAGV